MINRLHSRINRPENGYDPVSLNHAIHNAAAEWCEIDRALLDDLENWMGGFSGKKILDLGGGPGQYAVEFAKRGAIVTWFDVSKNYLNIASQKTLEHAVTANVEFILGYMDEAPDILNQQFDFVFNRICFYYCHNDHKFAAKIYDLVRSGGYCYVDTTHDRYNYESQSCFSLLRIWLNSKLGIKIGHPYPPHGRLAQLFLRYPIKRLLVDYSSLMNDRIRFEKI